MTNWNLINEVVKFVVEAYAEEDISETEESIRLRAIDWYNHSDISDFELLTAAVWWGESWDRASMKTVERVCRLLFPQEPEFLNEYRINYCQEITMAYEDWRFLC